MKLIVPAFSVALLALLAGCDKSKVNSVEPVNAMGASGVVEYEKVQPDRTLRKTVQIVDVRESYTGDLLNVQVQVRNKRKRDKNFAYQFEWFDAQGLLIDSGSPWMPRRIEAKETIAIVGTAPTPRAQTFRLNMIEPENR